MPRLLGTQVPWRTLAVFGALCAMTLLVGGLFTRIDAWYAALAKPAWTPPGAVIGIAWWTIFTLLAIAMAVVWERPPRDRRTYAVMGVLGVNLVLNVGWSYLFFTARQPALALAEIGVLWVTIAALVALAWGKSRGAALLVVPYLGWVSFATFLNATIVGLNP